MAPSHEMPRRGMPSLLRAARETYTRAVTRSLAEDGFDDVPRNGAFVMVGSTPTSATAVQTALGITKQAASQLIDLLVLRGYLERHPHRSDRRRTEITLTERGHGAAESIRRGVGAVDHQLAHHLDDGESATLRSGLQLLGDLNSGTGPSSTPSAATPPTSTGSGVHLRRVTPVFPVTDIARAAEHYASLGFRVEPYPGGGYGFAQRDGIGIHLDLVPDLDAGANHTAVYLFVSDADELAAQWSRAGVGGETHAPVDTEYRMREGSHRDPDGNLIRFGVALTGD